MDTATLILVIANSILAICTIWLAISTTQGNRLLRKQVETALEPNIAVYFEPLETDSGEFCVTIQNVGGGPAFDLLLEVQPVEEKPDQHQFREFLKTCFDHRKPVLNPGEKCSWLLEKDQFWVARHHGTRIFINSRYSKTSDLKSYSASRSLLAPSWGQKQLLLPPGHWREINRIFKHVVQPLITISNRIPSAYVAEEKDKK